MIPRSFVPARAVEVWCAARSGVPYRVRWRGRTAWVATVEASWRWEEGWWRGGDDLDVAPVSRVYHRLVTRDGLRCVIYRDAACGRWYLEAILD